MNCISYYLFEWILYHKVIVVNLISNFIGFCSFGKINGYYMQVNLGLKDELNSASHIIGILAFY